MALRDINGRELHLGDFVIAERGKRLVIGQLYREPAPGKMLGITEKLHTGMYAKTPVTYRKNGVIKVPEELTHAVE